MPTDLVVLTKPAPAPRRDGTGGRGGRSGQDGGRAPGWPAPMAPSMNAGIGFGFALAAVAMLFVAFATAYLGQRQEAGWQPLPLPKILWLDTAVLLGSSAAVEWGRRRLAQGDRAGLAQALTIGAALGLAFLTGQLAAWQQLVHRGIYLTSHPHSSFFFLLTGAHGAHLAGGLAALAAILPRAWRRGYAPPASTAVTLATVYWHFLTVLWLCVFAILFLL